MARVFYTSTAAHIGHNNEHEYLEQGFWSVTILFSKYLAGTYYFPPLSLISLSLTLPNLNPAPLTSITSHGSISAWTAGGHIQRGHRQHHIDSCYETHGEYSVIVRERITYDSRSHSSHSAHPHLHRVGVGRIERAVTLLCQQATPRSQQATD